MRRKAGHMLRETDLGCLSSGSCHMCYVLAQTREVKNWPKVQCSQPFLKLSALLGN